MTGTAVHSAALSGRIRRHAIWRLHRVRQSLTTARAVREPLSYLARELRARRSVGIYRVRPGSVQVKLRHHTDDTGVFAEVFCDRFYALDEEVIRRLEASGSRLRIVDLGANIGLFGAWVLATLPPSSLLAFEPDPASLAHYERFLSLNPGAREWRLVRACAGARTGEGTFLPYQDSQSRMIKTGEAHGLPTVTVPVVDVLPELRGVDILKMDIEGGEWDILEDARFGDASPGVVLMEYHPSGDIVDARGRALDLLGHADYDIDVIFHHVAGHGMVRAVHRRLR